MLIMIKTDFDKTDPTLYCEIQRGVLPTYVTKFV